MPKLTKLQRKQNLDNFLSKCLSLKKLLDNTSNLSEQTCENIIWYCDNRVRLYSKKYKENNLTGEFFN